MRGEETIRTQIPLKPLVVEELTIHFMLRFMPNGIGWKLMVICGIHNHNLAKYLLGHDIFDHLKLDEPLFVNHMAKYHMPSRYIMTVLKIEILIT